MANLLLNDMGKDMDDVLKGKVKVKFSWKEKMKYKIKTIDLLFTLYAIEDKGQYLNEVLSKYIDRLQEKLNGVGNNG